MVNNVNNPKRNCLSIGLLDCLNGVQKDGFALFLRHKYRVTNANRKIHVFNFANN